MKNTDSAIQAQELIDGRCEKAEIAEDSCSSRRRVQGWCAVLVEMTTLGGTTELWLHAQLDWMDLTEASLMLNKDSIPLNVACNELGP